MLAPLWLRRLGERGALALSVGGLALVRLAVQFARSPLVNLALATAGLAFLGWFIPLWHRSLRNSPSPGAAPVLTVAFPLALLLDTASRSLLLSYDLAWRYDWGAVLVAAGLVALTLFLLWRELKYGAVGESAEKRPGRFVVPVLRLGVWFYLTLAITHNPSVLMASAGWSDTSAHLLVNALAVMGLISVGWAVRSPTQPSPQSRVWPCEHLKPSVLKTVTGRWSWALTGTALLVVALTLLLLGVGPGWLWIGLAALNSWVALGEMVTDAAAADDGTTETDRQWRSGALIAATLAIGLLTIIIVTEYDLLWVTPVVGGILLLCVARAMQMRPDRIRKPPRGTDAFASAAGLWPPTERRSAGQRTESGVNPLLGAAVVGLLLPVGFWAVLTYPQELADPFSEERPLRVMTYNIHHGIDADWRMDLEAIARVISLEEPDVIILNEVNRARPDNGFVDTLPLISRQLKMTYVFGASQRDGRYGNAVLSRFRILSWDNSHYAYRTTQVRCLLRVVIDAPGGPINLFATHLDHLDVHSHARAEQIAEALDVWAHAPRTIFLGDLNAEPHAPELSAIYEAGFVDVLEVTGLDDVFTFWDPEPSRRLDFIFVTPDLPVVQAWVVPSRASDHLPVLAEVGP